jgi:hypothetical protein
LAAGTSGKAPVDGDIGGQPVLGAILIIFPGIVVHNRESVLLHFALFVFDIDIKPRPRIFVDPVNAYDRTLSDDALNRIRRPTGIGKAVLNLPFTLIKIALRYAEQRRILSPTQSLLRSGKAITPQHVHPVVTRKSRKSTSSRKIDRTSGLF